MARAQGRCEFKQCNDGRIATSAFEIADVLLGKAGCFRKLLLREALRFRNRSKFRPTNLRISIRASCFFTYYEVYLL